jgi:hypothetical protein
MSSKWRRPLGPYPTPNFARLVNDVAEPSMVGFYSGQITTSKLGVLMGAAKGAGKVVDAWVSIKGSGKDDSNSLNISGQVYINGASCLSALPSIRHVSGEAATNKTTKATDDTGVAQAIVNTAANSYSVGDVFTCDFIIARTASPTTEMQNAVIVVDLEPTN